MSDTAATDAARNRVLDTAKALIGGDRAATYGDATKNFTRIGRLWAPILDLENVTAEQVALCMAALKICRLCTGPDHFDSWVDGAGYLALGAEIALGRDSGTADTEQ